MTVTGLFTWLGGAPADAPALPHERSGYTVTGAAVLGFALVAGGVTAAAAARALPLAAVLAASAAVAAFAALVGRAGATARPGRMPDARGTAGRAALAVLTGVLIAELAATVLFAGTVERALDDRAHAAAESAPAVTAARAELEQARTERTALETTVRTARADINTALVTARCEFNPGPGCPDTRITGVPGDGPEARTANELLADARAGLAAAEQRVPALDQRVRAAEQELSAVSATAGAATDRGLGARWSAVHERAALLPRLLCLLAFVALALLPLLLRRWRGDTTFDRRIAADLVRDRAERDADAAIAQQRARTRAEAERVRAEQELTAVKLAADADTAIDRERQRTRVIAAIGGLEIGITEPARRAETVLDAEPVPPALPAAVAERPVRVTELPARVDPDAVNLPVLGAVPFSGTAVRLFRPFVPTVVADAIGTASQPLRVAVRAFEEREEITFTLRRTRSVRIFESEQPEPVRVAATVIRSYEPEDAVVLGKDAGTVGDERSGPAVLDAQSGPAVLDGRSGPAVLDARSTPALPPGR